MNSPTYNLLTVIGSPYVNGNKELIKLDKLSMYEYAKKNKMPLLYLKSIIETDVKDNYYEDYIRLNSQWLEIEERIKKVITIIEENSIKYTTFKSIKPYPEVTVDIDLLILGSYERTVNELEKSGYVLLERGPLSSTFRDPKVKIDYDIYDEVGVSEIIYLDKDKVHNYIRNKPFQSSGMIKSLSPELDLLGVIGHSVIKEQLYIIGEYYTTLYYLQDMDTESIKKFIELIDDFKLRTAVKAHLSITSVLHQLVHGWIPISLMEIVTRIGRSDLETHRLMSSGLKMPHKFHPITLLEAFYEKLSEQKARRSYSKQFRSMVNPKFFASFFPQFVKHVIRETY
jgi:hypothetical protein